jgi:16S rRNA (cytidine1402-2'-O)-methyltransferase
VSSIITALSAAGLATDRFVFHGFLSHKNAERLDSLELLKNQPGTHILLESTHRIQRLMEQVHQVLPQASVVLAKELTKRYERFIRGTAAYCMEVFKDDSSLLKGEFVVLLDVTTESKAISLEIDSEKLLQRLMCDLTLKKAVKLAADISGLKKNDLYQQALKLSK